MFNFNNQQPQPQANHSPNVFNLHGFLVDNGVKPEIANAWAPLYLSAMKRYGVDTPDRIAAFFSNVMHESSNFERLVENLNYSAKGLANTWPKRFSSTGRIGGAPTAKAAALHRNPMAIANNVYANRMGNGSESSGEGWKYRGRGPIQITGKNNYISIAEHTGLDCVNNPDVLSTPQGGVLSSCLFWYNNPCRTHADRKDIDGVRDVINIGRKTAAYGDAIGFADVKNRYDRMLNWIRTKSNNTVVLP